MTAKEQSLTTYEREERLFFNECKAATVMDDSASNDSIEPSWDLASEHMEAMLEKQFAGRLCSSKRRPPR